jgi:hypothetical protein
MNSMSASDAAPLPRLGEVFFDVRGSSRSMRLSWYSDTGVAVFSIWQGGTCTGTFRLPIEDLPRMTEALQRGPRGAGLPATDVPSLTGLPGGRRAQSGDTSVAPFAEYATGQHIAPVTGEFRRPELEERATDPFGSGGYRAPSPDPVYPPPASPSYREDPLTSPSFRDEARSGGYRQQSAASPIPPPQVPSAPAPPAPSFSPSPTYREDPLTSPSFRDEARSAGYRDSSAPYGEDPLGSGSYRSASYRDRDRPDQSYPDQAFPDQSYPDQAYPDRGYSGGDAGYSPGYPVDDTGGYEDRRYADDPFQSNYPDEPHGGSHPYGQPGPEPRSHRGRPSRT